MQYTTLGKTGLHISRICLGCMTFRDVSTNQNAWLLDQEATNDVVHRALALGINYFDTANMYNGGTSEIYLGNAIRQYAQREKVVLQTKVRFNEGGLSHQAILREVDASLKKLQTDYIDILIAHRWDYDVPIEETMEALNQVIQDGKVRHIGISAVFAYQLLRAQETARRRGWRTFEVIQNHYNLIYREEEREMFQLLEEEGMVMVPYSPLAAGRLARSWESDSLRSRNDQYAKYKYDDQKVQDLPICQRVEELARRRGVTMAEIAFAWLLSKPLVASPIVGVTKIKHLEDACRAVDVTLDADEIHYLEELYRPHEVVGAARREKKPSNYDKLISAIKDSN